MTQPQVFQELEHVRLIIFAALPCKKNQRAGTGKRSHYPQDVRSQLDTMTLQARAQWGCRKPIAHPDIEVTMYVANFSKDGDGIWVSVLDCLKRAGVIVDDSLRWLNGTLLVHPAVEVPAREERIEIVLEFPKGAADR